MALETTYSYTRLTDSDGIRLIVLSPSSDLEASVHCSLVHTSLTECDFDILEHYLALSYEWTDQNERVGIWIKVKKWKSQLRWSVR